MTIKNEIIRGQKEIAGKLDIIIAQLKSFGANPALELIKNIAEYHPDCTCHKKNTGSGTAVIACPVHD